MKWTGLNEIREKFLAFFESKEHLRLDSFSLIPKDDESLLLINSGMAPMKKYFTGVILGLIISFVLPCVVSAHTIHFVTLGDKQFPDVTVEDDEGI